MGAHNILFANTPANAVFLPSSIAGQTSWFKGSEFDATTDGTELTAWTDLSTAAVNAAAPGSAGNRPTNLRNAIGVKTAVNFASGKLGFTRSSTPTSAFTVFIVARITDFSTRRAYFGFGAGGQDYGTDTGTHPFRIHHPEVAEFISSFVVTTGWHYIVISAVQSGTISVWVDGSLVAWPGGTDTAAMVATVQIGYGDGAEATTLTGDMMELAWYNNVISNGNRLQLESYARAQYGL